MIETADPITFQLAVFIGAMALAAGIGGWRHPEAWPEMFAEFDRSPGLVMAIAFVALLFGALVLLLPGGWSDPLAIAVSAIGLLSLVEGLALLAFPRFYLRLARPLLGYARVWAGFAMALGAALFLAGLSGILA
jgi:hypothetical protein